MSHLPASARALGRSVFAALPAAARRVLSAVPSGDGAVPSPEAAFHCESALLTAVGVLHVLAPIFVLRASFLSAGAQHEPEAEACADGGREEAVGAALVALIQAVGSASGLYLLTASALCTAAEVATKQMLLSLSAGHLLNAVIYLSVLLNFSLPGGSLGLTVLSLALHAKLSAVLFYIARQQPDPPARQPLAAGDARSARPASDPQHQQRDREKETAAKRGAEARAADAARAAKAPAAAAGGKEEAEEIDDNDEGEAVERRRAALANAAFDSTLYRRL